VKKKQTPSTHGIPCNRQAGRDTYKQAFKIYF
jgi:hypothetical protein